MTRLNWRGSRRLLLVMTLTTVALADWLLYAAGAYGMNLALLAGMGFGLILWHSRGLCRSWPGRVVVLLTGGLVLALLEEPGGVAVPLTVLALVSLAWIGRCGWRNDLETWGRRWLETLLVGVAPVFRDVRCWWRWQRRRQVMSRWSGVGRWLLPAAIAGVFGFLFWVANPLIEFLVRRLGQWLQETLAWIELPPPARVLLWLTVAVVVWGLLRIRRRAEPPARVAPPPVPLPWLRREAGLIVRTLILCNAVFLGQNLLDSGFLWAGFRLPDGVTYAEYAHRGAYPLIATALLAAAFVLVCFRQNGPAYTSRAARALVFVWLGQNVFLTGSSLFRLRLYVDAYSLTRLRVAAGIWMGLVAVGLVLIIWRIYHRHPNAWLLQANFLSLLTVLYLCSFINFDGWIADWNVDAYLAGTTQVPMDVEYIAALGPPAMPALARLAADRRDPAQAAGATAAMARLRTELAAELDEWRGWTWRRQRLQKWQLGQPRHVVELPSAKTAGTATKGERYGRY